jgi:dTDP-D-glucose 4,6-dehydratase
MILITGAASFIGSKFVLDWLAQSDESAIYSTVNNLSAQRSLQSSAAVSSLE